MSNMINNSMKTAKELQFSAMVASKNLQQKIVNVDAKNSKEIIAIYGNYYVVDLSKNTKIADNFIIKKNDTTLEILLDNNSSIKFYDYFSMCSDMSCMVAIKYDNNNLYGDDYIYYITDYNYINLINNVQIGYMHGNEKDILAIAKGAGTEDFFDSFSEAYIASDYTNVNYNIPIYGATAIALLAAASISGASIIATNTINGIVVLGPVIKNNGLRASIYNSNGKLLADDIIIDSEGKFSVNIGSYSGMVLIKVIDTNDNPDYIDEAKYSKINLTTTLTALANISNDTTVVITPVTTIAARIAGIGLNGSFDGLINTIIATNANKKVATAFNLNIDITNDSPDTIVEELVGGDFNVKVGNEYGRILAVLSAIDKINNGSSSKTIADFVTQIENNDNNVIKAKLAAGALLLTSSIINNKDQVVVTDIINKGRNFINTTTLILDKDSGDSKIDSITNEGSIKIINAPAIWQWSANATADNPVWIDGISTTQNAVKDTFSLAEGNYNKNDIRVRDANDFTKEYVLDDTGIITIDKSILKPVINNLIYGIITVDLESNATWQYSIDAGISWQDGSGNSFRLDAGNSYVIGDIRVKQIDKAGNISEVTSNANNIEATEIILTLNDTGISAIDGKTSDNKINVSVNANKNWQYTLNATDINPIWTNGSDNYFLLSSNNSYQTDNIRVRVVNQPDTEVALKHNSTTITTSIFKPETPIIELSTRSLVNSNLVIAEDTGISGIDGITSNNSINIINTPTAWQWSSNATANIPVWVNGNGTTFSLIDGIYNKKDIRVRDANNINNEYVLDYSGTIVIDTVATEPLIISNLGVINVGLLEDNATWQYSINAGATWQDGVESSFMLVAGANYRQGDIRIKQTDKAGNINEVISEEIITAPNIVLKLKSDTGLNNADNYSYNGDIIVDAGINKSRDWQWSANATRANPTWTDGSGTTFSLAAGTYDQNNIRVRYLGDDSGKEYLLSKEGVIVIDKSVAVPNIVNNAGIISITNLEEGATWQYSINNSSWQYGSADSLRLDSNNTYNVGDVKIRQFDKAGNVSETITNSEIIVTTNITNKTTVTINNLLADNLWQYSTDGGNSWQDGIGASFEITANTFYTAGDIRVKQMTVYGIYSDESILNFDIAVDTKAPQLINTEFNINENSRIVTTLSAQEDGIIWSLSSTEDSNLFTIDDNGVLSLITTANFEVKNTYNLAVSAIDIAGNRSVQDIIVNILDINDAPQLLNPVSLTVTKSEEFTYDISADVSDDDNDVILYYLLNAPTWATIDKDSGIIDILTPTTIAKSRSNLEIRAIDDKNAFTDNVIAISFNEKLNYTTDDINKSFVINSFSDGFDKISLNNLLIDYDVDASLFSDFIKVSKSNNNADIMIDINGAVANDQGNIHITIKNINYEDITTADFIL